MASLPTAVIELIGFIHDDLMSGFGNLNIDNPAEEQYFNDPAVPVWDGEGNPSDQSVLGCGMRRSPSEMRDGGGKMGQDKKDKKHNNF